VAETLIKMIAMLDRPSGTGTAGAAVLVNDRDAKSAQVQSAGGGAGAGATVACTCPTGRGRVAGPREMGVPRGAGAAATGTEEADPMVDGPDPLPGAGVDASAAM